MEISRFLGFSVLHMILEAWGLPLVILFMSLKSDEKKRRKEERRMKRKKNNAMVLCSDGKQYWTTQKQFWQWFRDRVITKEGDFPLRGRFVDAHHEQMVIIGTTVLNLACPNHLREALYARRFRTY